MAYSQTVPVPVEIEKDATIYPQFVKIFVCICTADCSLTDQILKRANKRCAKAALVQVFGVAQVDDLVNELRRTRQNDVSCISSLVCKQ